MFTLAAKVARIVVRRLRTQGLRTTALWAFARGLPKATGVPIIRFSRVTPSLYVGGQFGPGGKDKLERVGVTASINLRDEFDDAAHGLAFPDYCYLPTPDDHAPTLADLERGVAFIHEAVAKGGAVYVHCAGGIGRAPMMAAAYLMSTGLGREEALDLIRRTRPFVVLTEPQLARLVEFEQLIADTSRQVVRD